MDADRERRRGEIEQEVTRRVGAARENRKILGHTDARLNVLVGMVLDTQDEIAEVRREVDTLKRNTRRSTFIGD